MLRELNRSDWQGILGIPDERIPQVLILRGTRNLKSQYDVYGRFFTNAIDVGSPNGLIEDVLIGDYAGGCVAYASVYGAAMASEITHVFGVLGTRLVVQTGCCGAWADGIQPGDLFVPTSAFCGEGAAQYYVDDKSVVTPGIDVDKFGDMNTDSAIYRGGIYTTAALFAEGVEDIERWAADGWEAVDMETATTLAVAEHFGMDSAALLYAFDNPRRHADLTTSEVDADARRERGNSQMIEKTFEFVERYLQAKGT